MLTRRHMVGGIAAIALIPSAVLAPINPALAYVAGELATWRAVLPSHLVLTAWLDGKTRNILVVGRNVKNGRELGFALTENLIADGLHERVFSAYYSCFSRESDEASVTRRTGLPPPRGESVIRL